MVVTKVVAIFAGLALAAVAVGAGFILLTDGPGVSLPGRAPQVTSTLPLGGATNALTNATIAATFSEAMDPSTINASTFTLRFGARSVAGTVTYAAMVATFVPSSGLAFLAAYSATLTTGAKDTSGVGLAANFVWNFSTAMSIEPVPPMVAAVSPAAGATGTANNAEILATFSRAMDPSTITTTTFTLKHGSTPVAGTVNYAGLTATFAPASNLASGFTYTATVTSGAKAVGGQALSVTFSWSFTTGAICDCMAARVSSTSPAHGATGVATNTKIFATFTEAMDPSTITAATFYLKQGTTAVSGLVSYVGLTATFDPSSDLAPDTTYTATVTAGAKDLAGGAMQADFSWNFTTGQVCDCVPPRVISVSPANAAPSVPVNAKITAIFSEAMDPSTITASTFLVFQGTTALSGIVSYAGLTATFDPSSDFVSGNTYTATITTGAQDLAGGALQASFSWSFTPGPVGCDCVAPYVVSTGPRASVGVGSMVSATFSREMDPSTVNVSTFLVKQGTTSVSGTVNYSSRTATFDPVTDFAANTTYTATLTMGIKDLAGHSMQIGFSWNFTTSSSACALSTVALGSAAGFAVLGGSTVTNTGATTVTGDLGVSPGTEAPGFPPGAVVGTIHLADVASAAAMADLTTAYNDAAGRTLCPVSVAGNLGGMTLTPGLYKSTSSLEISSGDLTLDAQGDADAVFIFQIASTLDVAAGLKVILAGGAKSSNIFWQVGTSATLGTNSTFVGTILADQSISLSTGATLDGRALARIGAVTLDTNTVAKPSG